MACDSTLITVPNGARWRTLEQADYTLTPLEGSPISILSFPFVFIVEIILLGRSFVLFLVSHKTIILIGPIFGLFSRIVGWVLFLGVLIGLVT